MNAIVGDKHLHLKKMVIIAKWLIISSTLRAPDLWWHIERAIVVSEGRKDNQ